jgi:hypothetical protein
MEATSNIKPKTESASDKVLEFNDKTSNIERKAQER